MRTRRWPLLLAAMPILGLMVVPILALFSSTTPTQLYAAIQSPMFWPALTLSLQTSLMSLVLIIVLGTPLALWLATAPKAQQHWVESLVDIPIVLPPAVVGLGLLLAFGRSGLLGGLLSGLGLQIAFSTLAVIIAQLVVAAPFYIRSTAEAIRRVDPDQLWVARTLGLALAWARALGEFGATLLFAGSLSGLTQTMPLAIYSALQSDVQVAIALALVLAATAVLLLVGLRAVFHRWEGRQ